MVGTVALVGSGEYLPAMLGVEAALLEGRPPRYVQLATAAGREGPTSWEHWRTLGAEQCERLGVEQVWLPVYTRADAEDPAMAAAVEGAGLIYLSGGDPAYLAETLRGTAVWRAIAAAWESGSSLAGCSAGAMALTSWVPRLRLPGQDAVDGLGLLPELRVIPHFDRMLGWVPDLLTRYLLHAPEGVQVLGIDEETALVGGAGRWQVQGRQQVWELGHGHRQGHPAGTWLDLA